MNNILNAAKLLNCEPSEIESTLNQLFVGITLGRKTTTDLVKELSLGECKLEKIEGTIFRIVKVVNVEVRNPFDESQILCEVRQEYFDKVVERNNEWISEKILGNEAPQVAAIRSIKEELGIILNQSQVEFIDCSLLDNDKSAYEGIKSKSMVYRFRAKIEKEDYRPEYQEIQDKKTTVFQWKQG